ncbi:NAD-dependent epimerase/dehydratase family protein [Undibacterium sp. CY18W]|uniref:NAD-dependent epimerase/dehydratase family protein n=1 Tax=Undibacterium hunanense TaxID=2762292 RepID=A0ABR6ZVF0_9BURK|nr:NAD-dependent epimerase/dehydratase family protein [Undibacterium hunanense]MBC3919864.1 NAD-dependent epimerase/dehydratase family protein [Undibacterium hunanense]
MSNDGILIIGGTGFMGSAIARGLQNDAVCRQQPIHILARHADPASPANVQVHRGSMDNSDLLRTLLPFCSTIIHAASSTTPGVSARQPMLEANQNILPTLRLIELLNECGPKQLLFFSSGGTFYGNPDSSPVSENAPFSPRSYYGAGKIAIEAFLQVCQVQTDSKISILRPSNVYGCGQPFRPGFGVIRTMLEHVLRDTAIDIWGDGETIRDFLYIDDLVNACLAIIKQGNISGSYNIGYGVGHSLNEVIRSIEAVCGRKLKVNYQPARQVDVARIVLNNDKLARQLNWQPQVSLDQGIALTWQSLQG